MKTNKRIPAWIVLAMGLLGACALPPPPTLAPTLGSKTVIEQPLASALPAPLANSVLMQSCTDAGCNVQPVDPTTGTAVAGFAPIASGHSALFAYAPNHRTLAMIVYPNNNSVNDGVLNFVDLPTWRATPTKLTVDGVDEGRLVFSPDSQYLVLSSPKYTWPPGNVLQLIHVAQQARVAEQTLDFAPMAVRFTADNSALMVYGIDKGPDKNGVNPTAQVALFKTTDLSLIWRQSLPALLAGQYDPEKRTDPHVAIWWHPATLFARDADKLYLVHADANRLTTVDFAHHTTATVDITVKQSWLARLLALVVQPAYAKELNGTSKDAVLSLDGQYLYVVGLKRTYENDVYNEAALPLQVIDLATHQVIAQPDVSGQAIAMAPDGTRLFLHNWNNTNSSANTTEWTEVVTLPDLQVQTRLAEQWVQLSERAGGEPILLVTINKPTGSTLFAALDPNSLEFQQSWPAQKKGAWSWWVTP